MPQAAGVNQRGSHICTSCGAIAHARVTEPSGPAGAGRSWGPRGGAGSRLSRVARGAQLGCPVSTPRAPRPRPLFSCSLPLLLSGSRGALAQPRPRGLRSPPPPSVSNTPAPGLLRRPGRLAAGARCHGDARGACFELFGRLRPSGPAPGTRRAGGARPGALASSPGLGVGSEPGGPRERRSRRAPAGGRPSPGPGLMAGCPGEARQREGGEESAL